MLLASPVHLLDALRQVQQDHPYAADGTIADSPRVRADADALWRRLLALRGQERDRVLRDLSAVEVRVVLFGARHRLDEPTCLHLLGRLFALRRPKDAGALAWDAWLLSGDTSFRGAAVPFVREHPEHILWPRLWSADQPVQAGVRFLEQAKIPFDRWAASPQVGLVDRSLFAARLRKRLLAPDHLLATSQREPHVAVLQWVNSFLPADEREEWYRTFLCATYRANCWKGSALIEAIIERFGRPDGDRPFWNTVPADVRREVIGWLNGGLIHKLLEGRRAEFWLRYRYDIVKIESSRARGFGRRSVFIGFDTWFAVQYYEDGKATYLFRNEYWDRLRWKDEPALNKEILSFAHQSLHLGRYVHMADYWEGGAQEEVSRVMKAMSARGRSR